MSANKALMVAGTAYHIDKIVWGQVLLLQRMGYEVHVAASFDINLSKNSSSDFVVACKRKFIKAGCIVHPLPFTRNPLTLKNFYALRFLRKLLKQYKYTLIHCHTPTGGLIARLASCLTPSIRKFVIYTAHGFHFYKGASIFNWLVYFPVEYVLARITDLLIVVNEEDELVARRMPAKEVARTMGAGVTPKIYTNQPTLSKEDLGLSNQSVVFICVAELSKRKNQGALIRSFKAVANDYPNATLLLAGEGEYRTQYTALISTLGLEKNVRLLGWRDDVPALVRMADVVVSAAKQEGLPVSLIEAMMAGKPLITSNCRGNRDLATQGGIIAKDERAFTEAMKRLCNDSDLRVKLGQQAKEASIQYEDKRVDAHMELLYQKAEKRA